MDDETILKRLGIWSDAALENELKRVLAEAAKRIRQFHDKEAKLQKMKSTLEVFGNMMSWTERANRDGTAVYEWARGNVPTNLARNALR